MSEISDYISFILLSIDRAERLEKHVKLESHIIVDNYLVRFGSNRYTPISKEKIFDRIKIFSLLFKDSEIPISTNDHASGKKLYSLSMST